MKSTCKVASKTLEKENLIFNGIILQAAKFENGGFASRDKQKQKPN